MTHQLCILLAGALALAAAQSSAADFFTAPGGNDANPGAEAKPFATIQAARDAARAAGPGPHRIVVMPGDYFLEKTLELDARDNGLTLEASRPGAATLFGGRVVTGWQPDGDKLWRAELPGVKEGQWDFRALVVNGRMPERARMPESGTFEHRSKFDVAVLPAVAGYWARQPTLLERTTMEYDPKDIPPSFEPRNAEVRVYHMWEESLVGVASNHWPTRTLTFTTPATSPPGAFGIHKYVVFNTREGMTKPGQWYLDRPAGRLVYWPLPGEDMTKIRVVAPAMECVVSVTGTPQAPARKITLRGLALQAATTPLKPAGFGAMQSYDGALRVDRAQECVFDQLEISNAGGLGIRARDLAGCQISACQVRHTGAGGVSVNGVDTVVTRNHIHHAGIYHPSAAALLGGSHPRPGQEKGLRISRNEIHDAPYCGIIAGGAGLLIDENLIYRVMREMHDGAAIYGNIRNSVVHGNLVRDVVKAGEGFGVSAYYLDEGSEETIIEHNVSIGVERPTHNHITRNLVIRNNVFIVETNMTLSFQRSSGCVFQGNTLFAPGKITVSPPNAVTLWTNNLVIREGLDKGGLPRAFTIDDAMPPSPAPARRASPFAVERAPQPPLLDGEIGWDEWPGSLLNLEREPSRWSGGGAPVFAKLAYDQKCLYVAVNTVLFDITKLSNGAAWGQNDGAEICIAGDKGTFVVRGFADGTLQSVADAGAPADAAARLGQAVRFTAKPYGKTRGDWKSGWRGEWAIPFDALGLKPAPGLKFAFNVGVYRAEDQARRSLEGTLAENWRLDQAATLQLK